MPDTYSIPLTAVENRTLAQALHEAHCITGGCAHVPSEADVHLAAIALAWVKLRMMCDDVYDAVQSSLARVVDVATCDDPDCTWEKHNTVSGIRALCAAL